MSNMILSLTSIFLNLYSQNIPLLKLFAFMIQKLFVVRFFYLKKFDLNLFKKSNTKRRKLLLAIVTERIPVFLDNTFLKMRGYPKRENSCSHKEQVGRTVAIMRQIVLLLRRHRFAFRFLRRGGDERIFRAVERIAEIYRSCRATIEAGDGRRWPLLLGRRSSIGKTPSLNFFQSRRVKYRINAPAVARAPINSTERAREMAGDGKTGPAS